MARGNGSKIGIRQATAADIPAVVELNKIAYPTLADENVVWGETHLQNHQRVFPQGQLVAEVGRIVGSISSLIVNLGHNPLRPHTWAGVTDSGYFLNHDASADTLYGADVCVHPDYRGRGVGHELYVARRELCRRLNLRRIVLGGRLYNYHQHAERFSPEEYAQRVVAGEVHDTVLSFQLKEGFVLRGLLPNYLRDPLSHNYATLLEWLNPDYKRPKPGARKVRVACVQYGVRKVKSFKEFARQVTYFADIAADYGSDFVMFPELFTVQLLSQINAMAAPEAIRKLTDWSGQVEALLTDLARRYDITIIGGSTPVKVGDEIQNVCHVCLPDGHVYRQPKLHVTPNERRHWGISGGGQLAAIDTPEAKIGVLICYDIEFPEAARFLADEGAEIIFVPYCTDNRHGYWRVRYCAHARAIENQVYVALAGNVGNLPDVDNMDINFSQAAVLTPSDFAFARDGIAAESDSNEETVLVCDLDLDDLKESWSEGTVRPRLDRRPDLFQMFTPMSARGRASVAPGDGPLGDQPSKGMRISTLEGEAPGEGGGAAEKERAKPGATPKAGEGMPGGG